MSPGSDTLSPTAAEDRNTWLGVSVVTTLVLVSLLLWGLFHAHRAIEEFEAEQLPLENIAGELLYHTTASGMAVRLAAATGNLRWEDRHRSHQQAARRLLERAQALCSTEQARARTERMREALATLGEIERRALGRISRGELQGARRLLKGWTYTKGSRSLAEDAQALSRLLRRDVRHRAEHEQTLMRASMIAVAVLLAFLAFAWYRCMRQWERNDRKRREKEAEILRLTYRDPLTGLYNRRFFLEAGEKALAHARRNGKCLSALMIDVDHFKTINDTHGHAAGDAVLQALAEQLSGSVRAEDVAARVGGEEFCILLPETDLPAARAAAERIRARIARGDGLEGGAAGATISVGVADSTDVDSLDGLMHRADAAVYRAKRCGRDCIAEAAGDEPAPGAPPAQAPAP